jgi:hypothetical protein
MFYAAYAKHIDQDVRELAESRLPLYILLHPVVAVDSIGLLETTQGGLQDGKRSVNPIFREA